MSRTTLLRVGGYGRARIESITIPTPGYTCGALLFRAAAPALYRYTATGTVVVTVLLVLEAD